MRHCEGLQASKATGQRPGKAEARSDAPSQDTALAVLVRFRPGGTDFSAQEKDEAGRPDGFRAKLREAFILRLVGA